MPQKWYLVALENSLQEERCRWVPQVFLADTARCVKEHSHGRLAEPVFNLDEVQLPDSHDRKSKNVVLRSPMADPPTRHGLSANLQHVSVMTLNSGFSPYVDELRTNGAFTDQ
jgi:hypothetical protein